MKCEYCDEEEAVNECKSCGVKFCGSESCVEDHMTEEIDLYLEHNDNIIKDAINKQIHKINKRDNNANN